MKFQRVYTSLQAIEGKEGITIEDALDLIYDVYEDIHSKTGDVLEQQPLGNRDEMVARLCWMARMTARLYRKNSDELQSPEYSERWKKASEKLTEIEEQLRSMESDLKSLQDKQKELDQKKADCEECQTQLGSVRDLTAQKEEKLKEYEKALQESRDAVEKTKLLTQTQIPQAQKEKEQNEQALSQAEKDYEEICRKIESLSEELKTRQESLAARQKEEAEISHQLETTLKNQQQCEENSKAVADRITEAEDRIILLKDKQQRLEEEMTRILQTDIPLLDGKLQETQTQAETLREKLAAKQAACDREDQQLDEQRKALQDRETELKNKQDEYDSISRKSTQCTQDMEAVRQKISLAELDLSGMAEESRRLKERQGEYDARIAEEKKLLDELKILVDRYQGPMERIRKRYTDLSLLRSNLHGDEVLQDGWETPDPQLTAKLQKDFNEQFSIAEKQITTLRTQYLNLLKCIES